MAEDALDVLNREQEGQQPKVDNSQGYSPSYQVPSAEEIKEEDGLQPITVDEQANQTTGGDHWKDMRSGIRAWRQMPAGIEKDQAREDWHQKFTGKSYEEFKQKNFLERGLIINNYAKRPGVSSVVNSLGDGATDFVFDVIGHLPGGGRIDDWYDEHTYNNSDVLRGTREFGSLLIPGMYGGKMASNLLTRAPKLARFLGIVGTDVAITGAADVSETDETLTKTAVDMFPNIVGPRGWIPVPEVLINKDSDSPEVTTYRNQLEAAGIPVVGNVLGWALTRGGPLIKKGVGAFNKAYIAKEKKIMGFFKAKDEAANLYKNNEISKAADPKKLIRLAEIDEIFASGMLTTKEQTQFVAEKTQLLKDLDRWENIEHFDTYHTKTIKKQAQSAAVDKMQRDPTNLDLDPDVSPNIVNDSANARQSVRPGNVAKNMVDVTTNEMGLTKGNSIPIVTDSVIRKVAKAGGKARDITVDLAEKSLKAGDFESQVLGIKISRHMMSDASFNLLSKYLNAADGKTLKKMFIDKANMNDFGNGLKVASLGKDESEAALAAYQILNDRYLGRPIAETTARVMETLGGEVSAISEAQRTLKGFADQKHINAMIRQKMSILYPEYRMTQHVWGVQGNILKGNINNLSRSPRQTKTILRNLEQAENSFHAKARQLTQTLEKLENTHPELMEPLSIAFEMSKGEVRTQAGLLEWAAKQVDPKGMIVSPKGFNGRRDQMNMFATATWSYGYNNILSGLSTLRAVVGNGKELANKPINAVLGHIWQIPAKGLQLEKVKKMFYMYGAVQETNARALTYMWETIKKVNHDPDAMIDSFRKDFSTQRGQEWTVLDGVAEHWRKTDDVGQLMQYDAAKTMDAFSRTRYSRFAMTGMTGVDGYTTSYMATMHARMRAYDEVLTEHGKVTPGLLKIAEEKHYKSMFNSKGMLTDAAVKNATGEVALNLDTNVSKIFSDATTAVPALKPVMMFPRSGDNGMRLALSYIPLANIPGINKYGDTIFAKTDDQIDKALRGHGLSLDHPNGRQIFEQLRTEYIGRQVFSGILVNRLWAYAMDGNIRGNGHYNGQRRINERRELGYEPLMARLPTGQWVSYRGIPGVQQVLSIIGDLSYYSRDLEQPFMEDIHRKLIWTVAAGFLNDTPLGGLEPLVSLVGGDTSGTKRLWGNSIRVGIPFSGTAGVLQNAIDGARRDINDNVIEVVKSRLPIASRDIAYARDIWTGSKINDTNNPWLARLNAFNPIKVQDGNEDWREWLQEISYRGTSKLTKDSTGTYEYNAEEREAIYELIGKQQPYKELKKLMNNPKYKHQTGLMRAHRVTGDDLKYDKMEIKSDLLPVYDEIDAILKRAQENAEIELLQTRPDIFETIKYQRLINHYVKQGRIDEARKLAKEQPQVTAEIKKKMEIDKLLKMKK